MPDWVTIILAVAQHLIAKHPEKSDEEIRDIIDNAIVASGIVERLDGPVALFLVRVGRSLIHGA